jgi:hypothetical protein
MPMESEFSVDELPNITASLVDGNTPPGALPVPLVIYQQMLKSFVKPGTPTMTNWMKRGWRMLHAIRPANPVEEVLAAQLILTEARLAYLQHFALQQTTQKNIRLFNDLCNHALNSLGHLVHSIVEQRRPRRKHYVTVRSANIAKKQIVNNFRSSHDARRPKKLAAGVSALPEKSEPAPPLPPDAGGSRINSQTDSPNPALEISLGTDNGNRQTDQQPERP